MPLLDTKDGAIGAVKTARFDRVGVPMLVYASVGVM